MNVLRINTIVATFKTRLAAVKRFLAAILSRVLDPLALMFLVLCAVVAARYFGGFSPTVRPTLVFILRGIFTGAFLLIVELFVAALLKLPPSFSSSIGEDKSFAHLLNPKQVQWIFFAALGEEILLRGLLFQGVLNLQGFGAPFAFLAVAIASFGLGYMRSAPFEYQFGLFKRRPGARERLRSAVLVALEGLVLAFFVYRTHSLFGVISARLLMEIFRPMVFRKWYESIFQHLSELRWPRRSQSLPKL